MKHPRAHATLSALSVAATCSAAGWLGLGGAAPSARGAGLVPTYMSDHSLCCGVSASLPVHNPGQLPRPATATLAAASSLDAGAVSNLTTTVAATPAAPAVRPVNPAAPAPQPAAAPLPSPPPTAAPVSTPPATAPTTPPAVVNGYLKLGFDRLGAFKFTPPPPPEGDAAAGTVTKSAADSSDQIPAEIKSYDGRKAIVTGFMLPIKMDEGRVTEFLLVKDPMMCCYGVVPNVNEWVVVRTPQGVRPLMDVPVEFLGTLHVGEMYENGYLAGIYLLDGEKMGAVGGS